MLRYYHNEKYLSIMREFEIKRKVKKRIYSKLTLLVLLVILLFVAHGAWGVYKKHREVDKDLLNTQNRLDRSLEQKKVVQHKIDRLETDVGKEEVLRENYSLAKDGEKAIFLLEDPDPEIEIVEEKKFFGRIGSFFGGLFN